VKGVIRRRLVLNEDGMFHISFAELMELMLFDPRKEEKDGIDVVNFVV